MHLIDGTFELFRHFYGQRRFNKGKDKPSGAVVGAARLLNQYGPIENFPEYLLSGQREQAMLFKRLATLQTDELLFSDIEQLRWRGPSSTFAKFTIKIGEPRLLARVNTIISKAV